MSRIILGKAVDERSSAGARWRNVGLDLNVLLRTHLLIWASTGGGKSWLIRRLVERAFGKVPIILVDSEGEFASLREKFGFVLVGKGGETPADVRSAKEVAEKLMELRASAVCDIFELKHDAKHEWVKAFVNGLTEAPKRLWGPRIIVIDEAHRFCPEKGQGESVAYAAIADLAGVARKRGLGIVLATQRLSKLSKNATGEMYNQAAGPTARQADRDRAAYEMGVSGKAGIREFSDQLRKMERGTFFFQGRAISMESILIKVGPVQTTHPEPGSMKYKAGPPPTPKRVKALLPKLKDLPQQAEERAQTVAEFRKEIRSLKAQLCSRPMAPAERVVERVVDQAATDKAAQRAVQENNRHWQNQITSLCRLIGHLRTIVDSIARQAKKAEAVKVPEIEFPSPPKIPRAVANREPVRPAPGARARPASRSVSSVLSSPGISIEQGDLTSGRKAILRALAEFEALGQSIISRKWVAALAGVSHKSSAYTNNLGGLRSGGYIIYPGGSTLQLSEKGREITPTVEAPGSTQEMLERCLKVLSRPQGDILKELHAFHPESLSRDDLANNVRVSAKSSAYTNNLGKIRSAGMLNYGPNSTVRCEDWLFID